MSVPALLIARDKHAAHGAEGDDSASDVRISERTAPHLM
jgi:hypothetical protein